jgi:glycosyltransferase involved in cell wall biosynthesis
MPTFSGGGAGSFYELYSEVRLEYLYDLLLENKSYLGRVKRLRKFIIENDIDVIVSFITNVNVMAVLSSLGLNKTVVVCERSDPFNIPIPFYWKILRNLTYPFSNGVLVQTNELLSKINKSVACLYRKKLQVIENPISSDFFDVDCKSVTRLNKVIAVGRLSKEKQYSHLIQAFNKINHTGWRLEVYGEGAERTNLDALVDKLGLNESVCLCGAKTDLVDVYTTSSIFCMTSLYEGFPNSLLEAMSSGCAVISYRTPSGPTEMLNGGQAGVLVRLNDIESLAAELKELMNNSDIRTEYSEKGRSYALEQYSPAKILKKWDLLFEALIKK